jgi:phage terminase large subunit-like protein
MFSTRSFVPANTPFWWSFAISAKCCRAFEGEAKVFVWCDEEPPMDIYTEILYRLLATKGLAWTTFTTLLGMSKVVMSFLEPPNEDSQLSKYLCKRDGKTCLTSMKRRSGAWSSIRRRIRSGRRRRVSRHSGSAPSIRSMK